MLVWAKPSGESDGLVDHQPPALSQPTGPIRYGGQRGGARGAVDGLVTRNVAERQARRHARTCDIVQRSVQGSIKSKGGSRRAQAGADRVDRAPESGGDGQAPRPWSARPADRRGRQHRAGLWHVLRSVEYPSVGTACLPRGILGGGLAGRKHRRCLHAIPQRAERCHAGRYRQTRHGHRHRRDHLA